MQCMLLTELTILACFHSLGMVLFLFCEIVISLFTFSTCQSNFNAHGCHLSLYNIWLRSGTSGWVVHISCIFLLGSLEFSTQKKGLNSHSSINYHSVFYMSRKNCIFSKIIYYRQYSLNGYQQQQQ